MSKARPELFYAYVGTGQVADEIRNYSVAYEELLKKVRALEDQTAVEELNAIGPPPYPDFRGQSGEFVNTGACCESSGAVNPY
jgi:hypothetical protein